MYHEHVEQALRDHHQHDGYFFPAYDDYCFGNVPDTIRSVVGGGGRRPLPQDVFTGVETDVERVVLVLIDGFGLKRWKAHQSRHAVLDTLTTEGAVTPLTSVYPSETAAAITTLETGLLPCEHGRLGWNVYEPQTDTAFVALGGAVKAGSERETAAEEVAVEGLHYPELQAAGVDCHRLQPFPAAGDLVTHHIYDDLDTFGTRLTAVIDETDTPGYVYAYVPHVDHVAHAEGAGTAAYDETVAAVCAQLTDALSRLDAHTAAQTLVCVTADHGHINTDPDRNIDLATEQTVMENLKQHADGTSIRLSGSPRNVHLHLQAGTVAETRQALSNYEAACFTRQEALERDLFGDRPVSDRCRRRSGDLIVTHRDLGMWFGDLEPDELSLVGMHGGLSPAEMLVPFAAARASTLT